MNQSIMLALCALFYSASSYADVTVNLNFPDSTSSAITAPIVAFDNSHYIYAPFGVEAGSAEVASQVAANLSTGSFSERTEIGGIIACPTCSGELQIFLPSIEMRERFFLSTASIEIVPWSVSLASIVNPGIQSAVGVNEQLSVGGGAGIFTGYGTSSVCIGNGTFACGADYDPSRYNRLVTQTLSGLISTPGEIDIIVSISGSVEFPIFSDPTAVAASVFVDPDIMFSVPQGVTVTSESGVFPVTYVSSVPEPSSATLLLLGIVIYGLHLMKVKQRRK